MLGRARKDVPAPVQAFLDRGSDFVQATTVHGLVVGMNALIGEPLLDAAAVEQMIVARDREMANPYAKDPQVTAIRGARRYLGDRLIRVAAPTGCSIQTPGR